MDLTETYKADRRRNYIMYKINEGDKSDMGRESEREKGHIFTESVSLLSLLSEGFRKEKKIGCMATASEKGGGGSRQYYIEEL